MPQPDDDLSIQFYRIVKAFRLLWLMRVFRLLDGLILCGAGIAAFPVWNNWGWVWSLVFALIIIAIYGTGKIAERGERRCLAKTIADREHVLEKIAMDTAGFTRRLLQEFLNRREGQRQPPAAFKANLENLQQRLLDQAQRSIENASDVEGTVWCNWAVPDASGTQFSILVANENHQRKKRTHRIDPILPGASKAFLTHEAQIVPDTSSPEVKVHFDDEPPYKSILSVPATVDLGPNSPKTVGVLNVDCTIPNQLDLRHANLVAEYAYLIGVCQLFVDDPSALAVRAQNRKEEQ